MVYRLSIDTPDVSGIAINRRDDDCGDMIPRGVARRGNGTFNDQVRHVARYAYMTASSWTAALFHALRMTAGILLVLPATASSHAPAEAVIPGTSVSVEQLLFAPGLQYNVAMTGERPVLCLSADLERWYKGSGLLIISGKLPFAAPINGTRCKFAIGSGSLSVASSQLLRSDDCLAAVTLSDQRIVGLAMQVLRPSKASLRRCIYRFGLFLEGYNGSLVLPDNALFVRTSQSIYTTQELIMGDDVPMLITQFRVMCADTPPLVTRAGAATVCDRR